MKQDEMEEIYNKYATLIYKYLLSLTNDPKLSEDLTQETFYQAMKGIEKFRGECKISVWLCQIGKNLWLKELRDKKYKVVSIDEVLDVGVDESIENQYINKEEKVRIFKRLHQLDEISREVIYLRLTGELNFAQIGEILDQTENWARVTFYRSKQKLMKGLCEDETNTM